MSYSRLTFSQDTIPPTPPPRSRPHSRSSCRGGSLKRNQDNILNNDKRKPPLAPPRSPVVKEKKVRKKIRDDDIKGILESVIARVSETDLSRLCEDDNEDNTEPDHLNQNGEEGNPSQLQKDLLDSLYALPVKQKMKDSVTTPEEEDPSPSSEAFMMSPDEQSVRKTDELITETTDSENIVAENPHKPETLLPKHEAMKANNARMDNLWSNVKHASNLSLNKVPNNNK